MTDLTLILVTSSTCGHCRNYLPNWENAAATIRAAIPRLQTIHIETQGGQLDTNRYPAALRNYLYFFPSFLLVTTKGWQSAGSGNLGPVKNLGATSNGGSDGNFRYSDPKVVIEYIKRAMASPQFQTGQTGLTGGSSSGGIPMAPGIVAKGQGSASGGASASTSALNIPANIQPLVRPPDAKIPKASIEAGQHCSNLRIIGAPPTPR